MDTTWAAARAWILGGAGLASLAAAGYLGLITGAVPIDVGIGRRLRPLGPLTITIGAPRETVFDVISQPYLGRTTRAMKEKVHVLHAGSDLVLAAHRTPVRNGLVATTVETVRFIRPERVEFRLVRGPVPHAVEEFVLTERDGGTVLTYRGELGTDFGPVGKWWADVVAPRWETVVAATFDAVKTEAERRSSRQG